MCTSTKSNKTTKPYIVKVRWYRFVHLISNAYIDKYNKSMYTEQLVHNVVRKAVNLYRQLQTFLDLYPVSVKCYLETVYNTYEVEEERLGTYTGIQDPWNYCTIRISMET